MNFEDAMLLTLVIKEEVRAKECRLPPEAGKSKGMEFPLDPPEGTPSC